MSEWNDVVLQGMAAGNEVRFFLAYTRGLVEKARQIHDTSPIATAALGRSLTAAAMMGAMCKNDSDVLTMQISGDGPLGGITVTADAACRVKGLVKQKDVFLPANKAGHLNVGELLPFAKEQTIRWLEEVLAGVHSVTEYFADGYSPEDLVHVLLGADASIEKTTVPEYYCNCSRSRVEKALISIGKAEMESMIRDGEPVTMHCDFCNTDYTFEIDELKSLLASLG